MITPYDAGTIGMCLVAGLNLIIANKLMNKYIGLSGPVSFIVKMIIFIIIVTILYLPIFIGWVLGVALPIAYIVDYEKKEVKENVV